MHVWHDWLVHGTIPLYVPRLSETEAIDVLVVLMEHGLLACLPLTVSIRLRSSLGQLSTEIPPKEVWIVHKSLGVNTVVIHNKRTVGKETAANASQTEVSDPAICKTNSHIERLNWELSNDKETESNTKLSTCGIVSPVEVGLVSWAYYIFIAVESCFVPGNHSHNILFSLIGPLGQILLENVFGHSKADKVVIGDVIRSLGID